MTKEKYSHVRKGFAKRERAEPPMTFAKHLLITEVSLQDLVIWIVLFSDFFFRHLFVLKLIIYLVCCIKTQTTAMDLSASFVLQVHKPKCNEHLHNPSLDIIINNNIANIYIYIPLFSTNKKFTKQLA